MPFPCQARKYETANGRHLAIRQVTAVLFPVPVWQIASTHTNLQFSAAVAAESTAAQKVSPQRN
jgi:hypothetical protein